MSIKTKVVSGVAWTSIGGVGSGVVSFLLTMFLARLLSPSDYGILELLTIFTVLSNVIVDSGFSQAIIRDGQASTKDLSSVFWINLGLAFVLYVILFLCAPFIANFYSEPQLVKLSRFVFLTVIINSLSLVQSANFQRTLNFRPFATSSILAMVAAGCVALFLAFKGYGVWALAVNMVLFPTFKTILLWVQSSWHPQFLISFKSISKYFKFGANLLITGLVDKFVTNMESLLIGKFYTRAELGEFSQARKLDNLIMSTSMEVVKKVTYPALATQKENISALKNGYREVFRTTFLVMIPLSIFLIATANNFILCVFGAKWLAAVPYFRLWCMCALMVDFYSLFTNVFLVVGKSQKLMILSLIRQILRVVSIIFLIRKGILIMLYGILCTSTIGMILYVFFGRREINYKLSEIGKDLLPYALYSIIAVLIPLIANYYLVNMHYILVFVIQGISMVGIYILLLTIRKDKTAIEILHLLKELLHSITNKVKS